MKRLGPWHLAALLAACASPPPGRAQAVGAVQEHAPKPPAWEQPVPADVIVSLGRLGLAPPALPADLDPLERGDQLLAFSRLCLEWLSSRNDLARATCELLVDARKRFETGELDRHQATERAIAILGQFQVELGRQAQVIESASGAIEDAVLEPLRGRLREVRAAMDRNRGRPHGLDPLASDLQQRMDSAAELQGALAGARADLELRAERIELLRQALWLERQSVSRHDDRPVLLQAIELEFWSRWS